ncbi:sugar phosphate isomerase/epimerase family protein [Fictibacillus phosphorivorans]|uniref:sugar phosphate isomerase/epimerase family protein n=1 Tax=Fictibacillus phosphorivorans TaxID=1221500 RepID=UPI00203D0617|nr:sugar phosphate isomerase/epimerase [Fictibacillus phosphorivorans]MCM3717788.1 sugar phosphate isomerase/epimerase [Fictibacillus phosphorivorans]MCM3777016.1 sugar phosphate isomerase/epimerase [Fictibacillus phosphorivorans]
MGKLGLQLFSVWKDAELDFLKTLSRVADLGYEGVQFAGFYNTPVQDLKRVMDEKGIKSAGAHVSLNQLTNGEFEKMVGYHEIIGNQLIICPDLPKEMRKNADDYKRSAEVLNKVGERCKELGFTFGYHNHEFEFDVFDGKTGFDLLFENVDPSLVKIELDGYWASYSGYDPVDILNTYPDQCVTLHVKDMKTIDGKKVSTEVGRGELDVESFVEAGKKYGVEWLIVEQEEFEIDRFEALKINATNTKNMIERAGAKRF